MNNFQKDQRFIRNRINENLLKVAGESTSVKSLLNLSVQTARPGHDKYGPNSRYDVYQDMNLCASCTSRKDLLRTCILLATSRNTVAQENLMDVISIRLGRIKDKDYQYIASLIYLKDTNIVDRVNDYLTYNLSGYEDMHKKYGSKYYGI